MNLRIAAAGAAAAVMICAGCREVAGPVATDLGSRASVWLPDSTAILAHSDFSSYGTATRMVVSDAVTWALAWNRICGGVQPPPPKPEPPELRGALRSLSEEAARIAAIA